MKVSKLLGERFKNAPSDCLIDSHKLMVRGGYMKYMANGIYSLFMPTKRITRKIENIIREEMDKIDGQEVMFPVVMPASLWRKSGRYDSIGSEMARFTDRNNNDMVLGMTHEEAAVHLAEAQKDKTLAELQGQLATMESEHARKEAELIADRDRLLQIKDEEIAHYKEMKARLSTKMVGESLEQHCETEFNKVRALGFPLAQFEKDNDARHGSKGDFIFRDFDEDGT